MNIKEFEFMCPNKIIFTHHLADSLRSAKAYLKVNKAFVVTDPGLAVLDNYKFFKQAMQEAEFDFVECAKAELNPDDISMDKVAAEMPSDIDVVIGFGGGSTLDTAKASAIIATNGGKVRDYFGVNLVPNAPLPTIAIPTTAGSGADITKFLAIVDSEKHTKSQIMDDKAAPTISVIYPENLLNTPKHLIPAVGFDSLTHAVEGYINAKANVITETLSIRAFELMSRNLVKFYNDNTDLNAASALLLATSLGCIACTSIGTGDAHCIARSVGGLYHNIHHGTALAISLPHVLNFNLEGSKTKLAELARVMGLDVAGKSELEAAKMLVLAVQQIRDDLGMPRSYKELGMNLDSLDELAEASKYKSEHGSSAGAPPRKATIEEYKKLITDAYNGVEIEY